MNRTVHTTAPAKNILVNLRSLPQEITSNKAVIKKLLTDIANTILAHIRRSFLLKSSGGTDEAGDRWAPLLPKTIARKKAKRAGISTKQKEELKDTWNTQYKIGLQKFKGDRKSASRRAWFVVNMKRKKQAKAFNKYARPEDILQDTGALLESLTPGTNSPDQILRIETGRIIIGTNRKGASAHHNGVPGRLPQRRLWPRNFPPSWWRNILKVARDGIAQIITDMAQRAR